MEQKIFKRRKNKAKFSFETGLVIESSRPAAELSYEFWIQKEDDVEQNIRLDKDIPLLEGQRVTMIKVAHKNKSYRDYAALINHNAKKYHEVTDIGQLFQGLNLDAPRFAFGILGGAIMLLIILIIIPLFDAVTSGASTAWNWRIFLGFVTGSSIELALSFRRRLAQPKLIKLLQKDLRQAADAIIKKYVPEKPVDETQDPSENLVALPDDDKEMQNEGSEAEEGIFHSTSNVESSMFRQSVPVRHETAPPPEVIKLKRRPFDYDDAGVTRQQGEKHKERVKKIWNKVKAWRPLKKQ